MKFQSLMPLVAIGLLAGCATNAANAPATASRTEVVFDHPEKFTDVKDGGNPTDEGRDYILSQIRNYLVECTASLVPEGYKLKLVFTDISLAGRYEPWRGPMWENVRIIKTVYPPSFAFTYSVTDSSGKVVKEGSEDFRDMDFQTRVVFANTDPLRYEKAALNDWARDKLRDLKKA
jgi:hypothetical protein